MVMAAKLCEELDYEKFQRTTSFPDKRIPSQSDSAALADQFGLRSSIPIDWCTAVFVLKGLLRQYQRPLSADEELSFSKTKPKSTNEQNISSVGLHKKAGIALPENFLQSIVRYLLLLSQNVEESSKLSGLTLQLPSSCFNIENNRDLAQKFANQILNRLLQTCDVINRHLSVQQTVVNMTSSQAPQHLKPARVAPPIPKQARPLPPSPIPEHANDGVIVPLMTSSPPKPLRSKSLLSSYLDCDDGFLHLSDSSIFLCSSDEELSDGEPSPNNLFVSKTISHVVNRHLFNGDSAQETWVKRTISTVPLHRHNGVSLHNSFTDERTPSDPESNLLPSASATSVTAVTTPDSGCGTAEDDPSHLLSSAENREPIIIPKLNLESAIDDDVIVDDITEKVPPLDLSEISPPDEDSRPSTPSRREVFTCNKPRHRRRKSTKSSPEQSKYSPPKPSSPINIPVLRLPDPQDTDDDVTDEASPTDGNLRWRDAWSTNEEMIPMHAAMDIVKHDFRGPVEESLNFELAPSSPENHLPHHHPHHHHHHHKRHHHHDNHLSRPKISNSLRKEITNHDHLHESLRDILEALDDQRKDNARPEDLTLMTREQIRLEKSAMQRELLKHESRYGRPSTKEEKDIMREVYERYRMVKRLLMDAMSPPFSSVTRRFDNFEYDVNTTQENDDFTVTQLVTLAPPDGKRRSTDYNIEANDHISGDVGITELRKQHKEAKGKRKRLRKKLQDFEKETEQQYGRPVSQADRLTMADEYREYHGLKLKLRLLDALIEKHNSQFR